MPSVYLSSVFDLVAASLLGATRALRARAAVGAPIGAAPNRLGASGASAASAGSRR